jgi:hypothetical protein
VTKAYCGDDFLPGQNRSAVENQRKTSRFLKKQSDPFGFSAGLD